MLTSSKSLAIFGLVLTSTLYVGCSSKKVSKPSINTATTGQGTGDGTGTPVGAGEDDSDPVVNPLDKVEALSSSFGLLNFRRLTGTFQALTGVTLANQTVMTAYNAQLSSLPRDPAPAQISAAKVSAATKLAAQYCDVMATTPTLLSAKFPGLSLTAAPADSMAFAKTLIDGFYGPEHALQGVRATDIASVAATVDALKALNGTGPAIFMASCAATLASAEFFLY